MELRDLQAPCFLTVVLLLDELPTKAKEPSLYKTIRRKYVLKEKHKLSYLSLIGIIFEMRLLNLRINFYLLRTFCPHLGSFFSFRGDEKTKQKNYQDEDKMSAINKN